MSQPVQAGERQWWRTERPLRTVAVNMSARYAAIIVELVIGLLLLPFNLAHLGKAAYGLWMLTASVTTYFSVLEMGYGSGLLKFVAQYRARRDRDALNEVLSTTFVVFGLIGLVTYGAMVLVALNVGRIFNVTPDQASIAALLVAIIGLQIALHFPFSVFGSVINGFQRYDINSAVSIATSVVAGAVNVAVLLAGYGLVELVAALTTVRIASYVVYRATAYRVFPGLRIRLSLFCRQRLREVSGFSIYMAVIDWAHRLNFASDPIIIGIFLNSTAVAVWTVGQRLAQATQRFTNQLNRVLFPVVVDSDASGDAARLRQILVQGTRFSLAMVVPVAISLVLLARPLIDRWVGPGFEESVLVAQLLALTVLVRVGNAPANLLLKGAGAHRAVAFVNLAAGLVNIGLSILLVRPYGLAGVAVGTFAPVTASAALVLFPMACRRVGLSWREGYRQAVWPAFWPGLVVAGVLAATREVVPASLLLVGVQGVLGGVVYLAVFYRVAIRREERRVYRAKLAELLKWRAGLEVAA